MCSLQQGLRHGVRCMHKLWAGDVTKEGAYFYVCVGCITLWHVPMQEPLRSGSCIAHASTSSQGFRCRAVPYCITLLLVVDQPEPVWCSGSVGMCAAVAGDAAWGSWPGRRGRQETNYITLR